MAMGTALAVGSAASSAIGAGMSFAQAARNRKLQLEAEAAAEKALVDAKKKLEVNYYDQLSLPMKGYELERDAIMASAAQAIEAGRESERGGVATAGKIQMLAQDAQQKAAADVEKQLMDLESLSAAEDARLAGKMSEISLAESAGAQQAAADYQSMAANSMQSGFGSINQGLGSALSREDFFALYGKVRQPAVMSTPSPLNPNYQAPPTMGTPYNYLNFLSPIQIPASSPAPFQPVNVPNLMNPTYNRNQQGNFFGLPF